MRHIAIHLISLSPPFFPPLSDFRSHNVSLHSSSVPLDCSNPDEIALGEEEEEEEDQQNGQTLLIIIDLYVYIL